MDLNAIEASSRTERYAWVLLVISAFGAGFSLPLARVFLVPAAACLAVDLVRTRRWPLLNATAWIGAAFVAVAAVATVFGVHPELGLPRLRKLLWLIAIPTTATLLVSRERMGVLLRSLALGIGVLAVETCIRNPVRAARAVNAGRMADFGTALIHEGSMTDGQRLMAGIVLAMIFLLLARERRRGMVCWSIVLGAQCAAVLVNMKRGSWFCTVLVVGAFMVLKLKPRRIALIALLALATLLVPRVRGRLGDLRHELDSGKGGRLTMWTEIAPALIREHPWGVGYRSLTNEMMRDIAPHVELDRDHLHSNGIQILVATGWLGLALYILWMASALRDAARFAARAGSETAALAGCAWGVLLVLVGLLANGLVEYNFGDSELLMIYSLMLGGAAAGARCFATAGRIETLLAEG